jgi:phosphohistidine phosphatase
MRTIYLIRHAKSSWDSPEIRDFDRPLNHRGIKDAAEMAELLVIKGVKPDLLVSSPAKRALTTASTFAEAFHLKEDEIAQNTDIYESNPLTILKIIRQWPDDASIVLIFGHNPTFTEVANYFARQYIDNIPTCGIVQVESTALSWREVDEKNSRVKSTYFPKELL